MAKLNFGVWIPTYAWPQAGADNVGRIANAIRKCDEYGFDVWVIDHLLSASLLYGVSWLEPLNMLAYAAALTARVKLATGVIALPIRHPVVLAKEIATLCHISGGRFMLGAGTGWDSAEFKATGSRIEERGRRTDEVLEAICLLLTKDNVSYTGRYYSFDEVTIDPRPATMPRIWIAGGSKIAEPGDHDLPIIARPVMDRIAKAGNWLSRAAGKQEWVKRDWLQIREHVRKLGRDPSTVTFGHCNFIHMAETDDEQRAVEAAREPFARAMGTHRSFDHLRECYLIGTVGQLCARIEALVCAGLQYLVLGPVTDEPEQIDLIAKYIAAAFT